MESSTIDFQLDLQFICQHYQQWWTCYTLTDAEAREALESQPQLPAWDAPFDCSLIVQTVQQQSCLEADSIGLDCSNPDGMERLPVLDVIHKYISNHISLVR